MMIAIAAYLGSRWQNVLASLHCLIVIKHLGLIVYSLH